MKPSVVHSPHTKSLDKLSSLSRMLSGKIIVLIECTGIDDSTAFVIVILPARLRVCFFHPDNREATFSRTSPNVSLFILFYSIGIPKYLPNSLVDAIPLSRLILSPRSLVTLLEKKILDFGRLTFCPEALQNASNTFLITHTCVTDASENRIKSSAKQICDNSGPPLDSLIGFHLFSPTASSIK